MEESRLLCTNLLCRLFTEVGIPFTIRRIESRIFAINPIHRLKNIYSSHKDINTNIWIKIKAVYDILYENLYNVVKVCQYQSNHAICSLIFTLETVWNSRHRKRAMPKQR